MQQLFSRPNPDGSITVRYRIDPADILAFRTNALQQLLSPPGPNTIYVMQSCAVNFLFGGTAYTVVGTPNIFLGYGTPGGFTSAVGSAILSSANLAAVANSFENVVIITGFDVTANFANQALMIGTNAATNFATGNGTIVFDLKYVTVNAN